MASKRHQRFKACARKRRYLSHKAATYVLRRFIAAKGDHSLAVYRCRFCAGYHFGHSRDAQLAAQGGGGYLGRRT